MTRGPAVPRTPRLRKPPRRLGGVWLVPVHRRSSGGIGRAQPVSSRRRSPNGLGGTRLVPGRWRSPRRTGRAWLVPGYWRSPGGFGGMWPVPGRRNSSSGPGRAWLTSRRWRSPGDDVVDRRAVAGSHPAHTSGRPAVAGSRSAHVSDRLAVAGACSPAAAPTATSVGIMFAALRARPWSLGDRVAHRPPCPPAPHPRTPARPRTAAQLIFEVV